MECLARRGTWQRAVTPQPSVDRVVQPPLLEVLAWRREVWVEDQRT